MKIVAFLQNQWVHNPDKLRKIIEKNPKIRPTLNKYLLFAGCATGKRLKTTLNGWIERILWEESSTQIGGHSSSCFKPDKEHMQKVIYEHKPEVVICFGKNSIEGFKNIKYDGKVLNAPHPVARQKNVTQDLKNIKSELEKHFNG